MASIKVHIVCPCGKLHRTVSVSENGAQNGGATCSGCKRQFQYQIRGADVFTNYKR